MKKLLSFVTVALFATYIEAQNLTLNSPDGSIEVALTIADGQLGYTVSKNGKPVYSLNDIHLVIGKQKLPTRKVMVGKTKRFEESFKPVVPLKFSNIISRYDETLLNLGSGCTMRIRVMDNGVAYRFELKQKGNVEIFDDQFRLVPADGFTAHYQTAGSFYTSFEESYRHGSTNEWEASDRKLATLPLLLSAENDTQLLVGETDVDDYPHQFLTVSKGAIVPTYPKSPLKWVPNGDRGETITEEAPYIARTNGRRTLPWRWVAVTDSKGIIEQTLPVQLARRNVLEDTSWILPGQVSWEWWNGASPFGPDVDFKSGCNYETYCYYADFASRYGIKYILLDEGWARSTTDPFQGNEQLRLPDLIKYCKSKGVEIILWLPWLTVEQHIETIFKTYAEWGITAVKIDFMDHADQWMTNFYKRVVAEAAKYKIIVDFHGAFTPAGLEYEYPNLISYEGIRGLEQMEYCKPENTIFFPFIRNAVGAADFTPGGMYNMQPKVYMAVRPNSGAMGTRCYQLALYIVLESGVQMLADNPTRYYQNDDCTRFITSVPTTWDETKAIEAKAGEYVVVAKRKGNRWFVGGITNGTSRDLTLSFDFLTPGQHHITIFKDGVNADYQAMHYNKLEKTINNSDKINVHLAQNGGWAAVID